MNVQKFSTLKVKEKKMCMWLSIHVFKVSNYLELLRIRCRSAILSDR